MYQLIIAIAALSQPFLCISSELQPLESYQNSHQIHDQPLTEKLKFPNNKLQEYARRELERKYPHHSFLKRNPISPQATFANECKQNELIIRERIEENKRIEAQLAENEKHLAIARKELKEQSALAQHIKKQITTLPDHKPDNKTTSQKSEAKQSQKKPLTTVQQRYDALKSLYTEFNAHPRTKEALYPQLAKRCDEISNNKKRNDSLSGPYFDRDTHALSGAITPTWSFVYCPCNGIFHLLNVTFCNISQSKEFINTYCPSKKCKQYEMDSYSSPDGYDLGEVLLSKQALVSPPRDIEWPVLDYSCAHSSTQSASSE